jgi:hypothetical protein
MRIHVRSSAIRAALAMIAATMPLPLHAQTAAYRWDLGKHVCAGCFDVSLSGGADGPLTGSVKTTAKGEGEKLKVDISFSATFGHHRP